MTDETFWLYCASITAFANPLPLIRSRRGGYRKKENCCSLPALPSANMFSSSTKEEGVLTASTPLRLPNDAC